MDSGNLAGHLIALANACEEWMDLAVSAERAARHDRPSPARPRGHGRPSAASSERRRHLSSVLSHEIALPIGDDSSPDIAFWIEALRNAVTENARDRLQIADAPLILKNRLKALAETARPWRWRWTSAFCLAFPKRSCCPSAFSVATNTLDLNCYDLLASEARLASFVAIAAGDIPARHWFRLGREVTPVVHSAALVSWSGSMFEYLMPSLVMRAPFGSLLERTNRLIVRRQIQYATELGLPWGISESAYNARDKELTYQYSNFGVPGLGFKRGLSENLVIAPYATGLAAMIDPAAAAANFGRLAAIGARGRYGFYEALDFTPSRTVETGEGRGDRAQLHGPSSGHDHRRHRQCSASMAGCAKDFIASR